MINHFLKTAFILLMFVSASAQKMATPITLPNGWKLSPAGKSFGLGDLPLNMALSKSGKYLAVTNNGQSTQSFQLIDVKAEKVIDSVEIQKSWYGIEFTSDERFIYVSGGHDNQILKYEITGGKLKVVDKISLGKPWPNRIGPAGLTIDESKNLIYVVTREDKQLYMVDLGSKKIIGQFGLDAEGLRL